MNLNRGHYFYSRKRFSMQKQPVNEVLSGWMDLLACNAMLGGEESRFEFLRYRVVQRKSLLLLRTSNPVNHEVDV